jgi:hypothetical protein
MNEDSPQNPNSPKSEPSQTDDSANQLRQAANIQELEKNLAGERQAVRTHNKDLQPLRTFESDVAEVLKRTQPRPPTQPKPEVVQNAVEEVQKKAYPTISPNLPPLERTGLIPEYRHVDRVPYHPVQPPMPEPMPEPIPEPILEPVPEFIPPPPPPPKPKPVPPPPPPPPLPKPVPPPPPPPPPKPKPIPPPPRPTPVPRPRAPRSYATTQRNIFLLTISIILIVGSGMAVAIIYVVRNKLNFTLNQPVQPQQIITTEVANEVVLTPTIDLNDQIAKTRDTVPGNPDSLVRILLFYSTSTTSVAPLNAEGFLERLHAPSLLSRSLRPEYIVGVHIHTTRDPFIILRTSSYDNTFAAMLEWEKTMPGDLHGFIVATTTPQATTTAKTTKTTKGKTKTPPAAATTTPLVFKDVIIRNKNVRVVSDASGKPLLMYSFPNKETIVITTNEDTFKEVIGRLSASQFVR